MTNALLNDEGENIRWVFKFRAYFRDGPRNRCYRLFNRLIDSPTQNFDQFFFASKEFVNNQCGVLHLNGIYSTAFLQIGHRCVPDLSKHLQAYKWNASTRGPKLLRPRGIFLHRKGRRCRWKSSVACPWNGGWSNCIHLGSGTGRQPHDQQLVVVRSQSPARICNHAVLYTTLIGFPSHMQQHSGGPMNRCFKR